MRRLPKDQRIQILHALVEGNSMRATSRITGAARDTVDQLLREVGEVCVEYQDKHLRNLPCKHLQVDEIWSYIGSKEKNLPEDKRGKLGYGDTWTFTALCADCKIVPTWLIGQRDTPTAEAFMRDLASRLAHRVQLTTDGHRMYLEAVEAAFGCEVDYSMLVKIYGVEPKPESTRYSPAVCIGTQTARISGSPDERKVSTSYVERQNLTMRMNMRRFTRLTNGFSKKLENLGHAVALHFMYYNFCRIHQTLRVTPAMEAGITKRPWELEDVLNLLG